MAISTEVRDRLRRDFPHLAALLTKPELADFWQRIYDKATGEGISDGEVAQLLWDTPWFRNNSAGKRQWEVLKGQDPAEAQRRLDEKDREIRNLITQWGIQIQNVDLARIVEQSVAWNLSNDEILSALVDAAGPTFTAGTARSLQDQIQGMATSYFQDLSRKEIERYSREILANRMTIDSIEVLLRDRAKQEYAHLGDRLDNFTMEDITAGIRSQLAMLLDKDPSEVDLRDKRYNNLLRVKTDDGYRMATRSEVGEWGRNQHEFQTSDAGREMGTSFVASMARAFGKGV